MKIDREFKTRQATMVFKPSVFEAFQKVAYMKHTSVGNLVGILMEECIKQNQELITEFDSKK